MSIQVGGVGEGGVAVAAVKGPFPSVNANVNDQIGIGEEDFAAVGTRVSTAVGSSVSLGVVILLTTAFFLIVKILIKLLMMISTTSIHFLFFFILISWR